MAKAQEARNVGSIMEGKGLTIHITVLMHISYKVNLYLLVDGDVGRVFHLI